MPLNKLPFSSKKIIDFTLFSNLFISLCSFTLTLETYFVLHIPINIAYLIFVFSSTLFLYNFQRIILSKHYRLNGTSIRHHWILNHKKSITYLLLFSLIAMFICVLFLGVYFVLAISPFALLSLFYFLPTIKLRNIAGVKALLVAFVWAVIGVYFPLVLHTHSIAIIYETKNSCMFLQQLLFILSLTIIFNVRDIEHDREAGVQTIPSIWGITVAKTVAIACLLVMAAIISVLFKNNIYSIQMAWAWWISILASVILILFNTKKSTEYYYVFAIDGMILLQAGLTLILAF